MSSLNSENSASRPGCLGPPSTPISTAEPAMTPTMLPMPPKMTTTRITIDTRIRKLAGNTEPTFAEKIAPLNDPSTAPTTNASSLTLTVLMPMASATVSSSRTAIHARPMRDRSSRHDT